MRNYKERKYKEGNVLPVNVVNLECLVKGLDFKEFCVQNLKNKSDSQVKTHLNRGSLKDDQIELIAKFIDVDPEVLKIKK